MIGYERDFKGRAMAFLSHRPASIFSAEDGLPLEAWATGSGEQSSCCRASPSPWWCGDTLSKPLARLVCTSILPSGPHSAFPCRSSTDSERLCRTPSRSCWGTSNRAPHDGARGGAVEPTAGPSKRASPAQTCRWVPRRDTYLRVSTMLARRPSFPGRNECLSRDSSEPPRNVLGPPFVKIF